MSTICSPVVETLVKGASSFLLLLATSALTDAAPPVQTEKCRKIQIQKRVLLRARSVQY